MNLINSFYSVLIHVCAYSHLIIPFLVFPLFLCYRHIDAVVH